MFQKNKIGIIFKDWGAKICFFFCQSKVSTGSIFPIKSYKSLCLKNGLIKTQVLFFAHLASWKYIFIEVTKKTATKMHSKVGYRQLTRQLQTHFVAVSREKIMLHENYLHTFRLSYYFLLYVFFHEKIPSIS